MAIGERRASIELALILAACGLLGASGCLLEPEEPSPGAWCLPETAADGATFNYGPHLEQDDAGNVLLWWRASEVRSADEESVDARIQMAAWDGRGFSAARQPEPAHSIALHGPGRWLAVRTPEGRIELETTSPDCDRDALIPPSNTAVETPPQLATNGSGELVLAWNEVLPDGNRALNVSRAPAGGTLSEPQFVFQVWHEQAVARVGLDEAGGAALAFSKAEPVSPELSFYQTSVMESSGSAFSPPVHLVEGMPSTLIGDTGNGRLLVVPAIQAPATTLHLQRFDTARGWTALPDYACQRPACDAQFGLLQGGALLIVERTWQSLHAVVLDESGARDALSFPEYVVGAAVLSHALSVAPDGTARSLWLTEKEVLTATYSLDSGWSVPKVLLARPIQKEDQWLGNESGSPLQTQYPMRVARLADGRLLAVWAELGDIYRETRGDTAWLEAHEQELWSLVTDGTTATVARVAREP